MLILHVCVCAYVFVCVCVCVCVRVCVFLHVMASGEDVSKSQCFVLRYVSDEHLLKHLLSLSQLDICMLFSLIRHVMCVCMCVCVCPRQLIFLRYV